MSGRRGYVNLEGYSAGTVQTLAALLVAALIAVIVLAVVLPITVRAPCTKGCGDLSISCDEYCVTDIIVGGGTTGLSLANALSDNSTRDVLVFETGGNHVNDPLLLGPGNGLFFEDLFLIEPYRYHYDQLSTIQFGEDQMHARSGRVLGGTSTINDCAMFKGTPNFWNTLEAWTGNTGRFESSTVYEIIKRIEWLNYTDVYTPDATRGLTENAWKLEVVPRILNTSDDANLMAQQFANALGFPYPPLGGPNDPSVTVGVMPFFDMLYDFNATVDPIVRWSSQKAFLNDSVVDPDTLVGLSGRKLRILTNSMVEKILFHPTDTTRAVGVRYRDPQGVRRNAYATSNVIVSAFHHTPQILQRSGVGPTTVLSDAGIEPQVVNEHVGENLRVHDYLVLIFFDPAMSGVANAADGPLISGFGNVFVEDPILGSPGERGYQYITVTFPYILAAFTFQLNASSTGFIHVYSDDPNQPAKIEPNMFTNPNDVISWRTHLRNVITAVETANPGVFCLSIDNATLFDDGLFETWLHKNTNYENPFAHAYGTARLSTDPSTGAIDPEFRVWGAQNLRVCDTQVFPNPTDGNPTYSAAGLGQICARTILGLPPSPSAKKRSPKPQRSPTTPVKKAKTNSASARTTPSFSQDDYNRIVAFFDMSKQRMSATQATQVIAGIQATAMWKTLEAQYGPYVGKKKR
jgi:choline dehydrogenase-like flavoprotein